MYVKFVNTLMMPNYLYSYYIVIIRSYDFHFYANIGSKVLCVDKFIGVNLQWYPHNTIICT